MKRIGLALTFFFFLKPFVRRKPQSFIPENQTGMEFRGRHRQLEKTLAEYKNKIAVYQLQMVTLKEEKEAFSAQNDSLIETLEKLIDIYKNLIYEEKRRFIGNLILCYLFYYPTVVGIFSIMISSKEKGYTYLSLSICFSFLILLIRKFRSLNIRLGKYIALLDIKGAMEDKKLFLIRVMVLLFGVLLLSFLTNRIEHASWGCGALCLNNDTLFKIQLPAGYAACFCFLFCMFFDVKELVKDFDLY